MEKIYFCGSITGGRGDIDIYRELITHLGYHGEVLTKHIADPEISDKGETQHPTLTHDRDLMLLDIATSIVAEVSTPSLGIGYEIGRIIERNKGKPGAVKKRILTLHRPESERSLSNMILGCRDLIVVPYKNVDQAKNAIDSFYS
jgi:2'-deoxynucleoside 5'-phosphate N-hydrolase